MNANDEYTDRGAILFRRPVWVMLTLLLGTSIAVWVASYRHSFKVYWIRECRDDGVGFDRGFATVWLNRQWADWAPQNGWHLEFRRIYRGPWPSEVDLTHEFDLRHGQNGSVTLQAPMWAITLVAALPQLVFMRRQSRKIGFPVSPVAVKN